MRELGDAAIFNNIGRQMGTRGQNLENMLHGQTPNKMGIDSLHGCINFNSANSAR